jgi:hypothetical protein
VDEASAAVELWGSNLRNTTDSSILDGRVQ